MLICRHPLVMKYDYYWRIEPGVRFLCNVNFDPFTFMKQRAMPHLSVKVQPLSGGAPCATSRRFGNTPGTPFRQCARCCMQVPSSTALSSHCQRSMLLYQPCGTRHRNLDHALSDIFSRTWYTNSVAQGAGS